MKILLIESPYTYDSSEYKVGRYFPLGLGYISAYLRKYGHEVWMISGDYQITVEYLKDKKPDLVGISSMTSSFSNAVKLAEIIKNYDKSIKIILGGQHPSALKKKILENYLNFDYVIYGEGEESFLNFLNKQENLDDVKGLIFRDSRGAIIENPSRPLTQEIDELPFPKKDLANYNFLGKHPHFGFRGKTVSMITSRGCPYNCTFCSSCLTMGKKYRFHSSDYIFDAIEYIYRDLKINNIVFWDDVFTLIPDRLEEICKKIIYKKIKINWYCLSRANLINKDLAMLMKSAGCSMISFGIESGKSETLEKIKKKISLEEAKKAIEVCEKAGIKSQATFILGFPFEKIEDVKETIEFAKRLPATFVLFFSFVPYPGTELYQDIFNVYEDIPEDLNKWEKYIASKAKPVSYSRFITSEELQELIKLAHNKFYFNFKQINRILRHTRSIAEIADYLKLAAGLIKRGR